MTMSFLYLVRHAQASFGKDHFYGLSEVGIRQSEILGEYFRQSGVEFDAVYSGAMERQIQTARIAMSQFAQDGDVTEARIAAEFDEYAAETIVRTQIPDMIREDPSFQEDFDRIFTDRRSLERIFTWAMHRWMSGRFRMPGLETWPEFKQRVRRGVDRMRERHHSGKRVLIFTSAGALSVVLQMALGVSDETTIRLALSLANASISVCEYDSERLSLSCFNSTAHVKLHNDSGLLTYR